MWDGRILWRYSGGFEAAAFGRRRLFASNRQMRLAFR